MSSLLSKYLNQVFTGLHEAHRQLLQEEVDITSAGIKARYSGEDEKGKTLLDVIAYHNSSVAKSKEEGLGKARGYFDDHPIIYKDFKRWVKRQDSVPNLE